MTLTSTLLQEGNRPYHSDIPRELLTGTGAEPRPRLRVDPAQTSFLEGRQFRVFHEFNVPNGTSLWLRFVAPLDVVTLHRFITVVQGNLRFALGTGGTPAGPWTAKTVFPVNSMSTRPLPVYAAQVTSDFGGSVTGTPERDVQLLETGTSQAVSVQSAAEEVGQGAGTYYVELRSTGTGAVRGIYTVVWEEVQPSSASI